MLKLTLDDAKLQDPAVVAEAVRAASLPTSEGLAVLESLASRIRRGLDGGSVRLIPGRTVLPLQLSEC